MPPISEAAISVLAWLLSPLADAAWPDTITCVVAVASGKGYLPCMSFTKYLRKGMKNRIPRMPPSSDERNIW